jgi:uncharacterized protein YndB with AHSA1/START domain
VLSSPGARATVVESTASGFAIEETAHIAAAPDKVYAALIEPGRWWNKQHTFSGDAANMSLEARAGGCLCERLPDGGSVEHLQVVRAEPGHVLGLRGALGPFQAQGVDGALSFTLTAKDGGTDLVLDNNIGGFMKGGFGKWPTAADGMLSDLVAHLKAYAERPKT